MKTLHKTDKHICGKFKQSGSRGIGNVDFRCRRRPRQVGWSVRALVFLCVLLPVRSTVVGQTLYNINFSQFTPGTVYTSASGPPSDFSSYSTASPTAFTQVVSSYLGLTDQPLTVTEGGLTSAYFVMNLGNISSNVLTLSMQLALSPNIGAGIGFSGTAGAVGTGIILSFPTINTNVMEVDSTDGSTFMSSAPLYSLSTNVSRSEVQNIQFSLNTLAHTFDLTVNNVTLATNAPFGSSAPITIASIDLGDTSSEGVAAAGEAGIDNIVLTASAIPEPGTLTLVALTLPLMFLLRHRKTNCS